MSRVAIIEAFILTNSRDEPYFGALRAGEEENERGYSVRKKNQTVYSEVDRSILVHLETKSGIIGWGETYGIVAPRATIASIEDFLADFVVGREPFDVLAIHDDLYNMMRFCEYNSGYYLDALAAIDIALGDAAGRIASLPLAKLLDGRRRNKIPAYVSGLPKPTMKERAYAETENRN